MKNEVVNWFLKGKNIDSGIELMRKLTRNKYMIDNLLRKPEVEIEKYLEVWLMDAVSIPINERAALREQVRAGFGPDRFELIDDVENSTTVPTVPTETNITTQIGHVEKRMKLREEFPFLSNKNCPDVYKILVNEMLSTHEQYIEAHTKLFEALNIQECFHFAKELKTIYLENRMIWDELNYYKIHSEPLGKHKIFEKESIKMELSNLSMNELTREFYNNIPRKISYHRSKLTNCKKADLINKHEAKIEELEFRKNVISEIIGIKKNVNERRGRPTGSSNRNDTRISTGHKSKRGKCSSIKNA